MATYAVSDLHGCACFYHKIKALLKPEDEVYFLGDAGDRGPQPWETIKLIASDPQFIYMKGNHEDMLCAAMKEFRDEQPDYYYHLLCRNGGMSTIQGWIDEGCNYGWIPRLRRLPTHLIHYREDGSKVYLSHAGYTPNGLDTIPEEEELLWDRSHFYVGWDDNAPNCYIVHGHTPIDYLAYEAYDCDPEQPGAVNYCEGRKFCIDAGCVAYGRCILFNLDTFESIVLTADFDELGGAIIDF